MPKLLKIVISRLDNVGNVKSFLRDYDKGGEYTDDFLMFEHFKNTICYILIESIAMK